MEYKVSLIFLMASSNILSKIVPMRILSGRKLPKVVTTWLTYVPVPMLSAMLASDLFLREGKLDIGPSNEYLWVAVPCFLIAYKSRNMFFTVLSGMGLLALLRVF